MTEISTIPDIKLTPGNYVRTIAVRGSPAKVCKHIEAVGTVRMLELVSVENLLCGIDNAISVDDPPASWYR